ncbi:MAG: NUDIX hydrolase [Turicibacter sp.]|nr:NUDIX hydrolase [Turicibacter sp.]
MSQKYDSLKETTVSSTEHYRNSFLRLTEDEVILPDGKTSTRVVVHHPGGVNLIALDDQQRLILVEQFRYPVGGALMETPAGKCEPGEENILTAARELEEETGYRAKNLKSIGSFTTAPGFSNEIIENFLATGLTIAADALKGDDDEFLNLFFVTKEEAWDWVKDGKIMDYKTIYAIQYLTIEGLW